MTTHESYVSLEIAKMLKKVGFDWECRKCHNHEVMFDMESDEIRKQCPQHSQWDVPAPTLAVAQRWLREIKKMVVSVDVRDIDYIKYGARIHAIYEDKEPEVNIPGVGTLHFVPYGLIFKGETEKYNTYEEALEAGIKKCLTIILNEKK